MEHVRAAGIVGEELPPHSIHTVTVPGAAAGLADTVAKFGRLTLPDVLAPAIELAEQGVPIHGIAAHFWQAGSDLLRGPDNPHGGDLLMPDGQAPRAGDVMVMPHLARTFRLLADHGKAGFYTGRVAEAIVTLCQRLGGAMTMEDLASHATEEVEPLSVKYGDIRVWEIPPNGQGLTALMALNILKGFDLQSMGHNSPQYLHHLIEAIRLAFADTRAYVTDPEHYPVPISAMLVTITAVDLIFAAV